MAARRSRGGAGGDGDEVPLVAVETTKEGKERYRRDTWLLARVVLPGLVFLFAVYDLFLAAPPVAKPAAHAFAVATQNVETTVELICKTPQGTFYVHDVDGRATCSDDVASRPRTWQRRTIDRGAGWFALRSRETGKWLALEGFVVETELSEKVEIDARLHWRFRRKRRKGEEASSVRHLESRIGGARIEVAQSKMVASSEPSPFALRVVSDQEIAASERAAALARKEESRRQRETLTTLEKGFRNVADETKVISMGLYGSQDKYCVGAIRNAELAATFFPGWKLRIYADERTVPSPVLQKLSGLGVDLKLIKTSQHSGNAAGMFWRFFVADDPSVDRFIVRDSDSRLNPRDAMAVLDWVNSGFAVHSLRDHPNHDRPLNGGMWGATSASKISGKMKQLARDFFDKDSYGADLNFLDQDVYPLVADEIYAHDSYTCFKYPGSVPFPTRRPSNLQHVGQVFDEFDNPRMDDIDSFMRGNPTPIECRGQADWTYG